ncbi:MAG: DNA polymerase III subunit delta [Candidatus Dormibacterales bacterium]
MPASEPAAALFHGEESFLVAEAADATLARWRNELVSDFGFEAVEASRLSAAALRDVLLQAPFLDPFRVIALRWVAPVRAEGLAPAFADLPDTTRVVVTVHGRLAPGNALARAVAALEGGRVTEFQRLRGRRVEQWTAERARSYGISAAAAALVARVTPPDLGVLDAELRKLADFQAAGGSLTKAVLDELVAGGREEDLYRLSDHLLPRPTAAAWHIARGLLEAGTSATMIAHRLARHLSLVLEVKAMSEEGADLGGIQAGMREHPYVVQKAYEAAGRVADADLERGLRVLLDYEWEVKSGQIEAEPGLEAALARL